MRAALGIQHVTVWDTDPAALLKVARNLEPLGFDVTLASSGREAVREADVVTTCTADKAYATVLPAEWINPGMHINAIGGDCPGKTELDPRVLRSADVFVEYTPQTRIEGEIQALQADFPVTELWEVLTGRRPGRATDQQVTVFDSVGFAVEDFSALRFLRDSVRGTTWVDEIDLVAEPDDPKDPFGMVTYRRASVPEEKVQLRALSRVSMHGLLSEFKSPLGHQLRHTIPWLLAHGIGRI